jgi:CheY-like chemotaxis protein
VLTASVRDGRRFDLILLDAQMPDMDGFELARQIAGRTNLAGATIMMLTSSGRYDYVSLCREIGISSCLNKPITSIDLHDAMCAALDSPAVATAQPPSDRPPSPVSATAPPAVEPRRILLAEDNIVNQRVAIGLLARRGHHVTLAVNGQEAVDAVARERFDLVLMDLQMPVMGGIEATMAIRDREQNTGGPRVRIVAMTAHAMTGDRERCLAAGMDGYLAKPTEPRVLFAEVEGAAEIVAPHAPIDRADLLRRLHGDEELAAETVRLFIEECPVLLDGIRRALDRGDAPAARRAAHTLKGSAATAGATGIADAASLLEVLAADGGLDALASAWQRVLSAAATLLTARPAGEPAVEETP